MLLEPHREPLPEDYSGWEEDFPEPTETERKSSRWTTRSIVGGVAVFTLVLGLGYYFGTKKGNDSSAAAAISQPLSIAVQQELARSLREIETLKKAVSDQNGTNQHTATAIAALQSEQNE
jgi:hypothetical protein